jgi:hypothetical protein
MVNYDKLLYWVLEREAVRKKKEMGMPKPWSYDPVFHHTYFCNVHREDDKVTRFIRKLYSPYVRHSLFVHNIILSRFLNWPPTLDQLDFQAGWDPPYANRVLNECKAMGKVWGNAYVVSTCGRQMDKIDYLTQIVMPSVEEVLLDFHHDTCWEAATALQFIEGISTFMAGQVIADLKNTPGHSLQEAEDWWTFALPGPGSRRGMDWLYDDKINMADWPDCLEATRIRLRADGMNLCAQDTQNCLCEFDKYMRVLNGTGRSKRSYQGV